MSTKVKNTLRQVMSLAWQLVKRNGYTMSEALRVAWLNIKLKVAMYKKICKFYFRKVDGSLREAYGTLKQNLIPAIADADGRHYIDTVQVYYDTEVQGWRCFKKANLISIE